MVLLLKLFIFRPFMTDEVSVEWIEVLSPSGEFLIMPGHFPLISSISEGKSIVYKPLGLPSVNLETSSGLLRVEREDGIVSLFL